MNFFDLVIVAAATAYLAFAITTTRGPFRVFARLRAHLPLGGLTTCIYCLAPWTAGGLLLLYATPARVLVEALAVAGLALMAWAWSGAKHVGE